MGLSFSTGKASWSFSGFRWFRQRIQNDASASLADSQNPLNIFLNHSDCEGAMSAKECGKVAPLLKPIVENLRSENPFGNYDKENGLLLVEAMEECARENKPLVFRG